MTGKETAATSIRASLDQVKQVLSGPEPPRFSESDTKANFIEKYLDALGYRGLSDITREYYVKNSQEFIDYVPRHEGEPILAMEAKALGFINGLPLVFIELKASHKRLRDAYDKNLRDYRDAIPHVFIPNACIVLSNGRESKIGTITSSWEHFAEWKKIANENEPGSAKFAFPKTLPVMALQ